MPLYDTDVFVVGGGPAGLAAAIGARRRGMRVMLADAATVGVDKCCGEGLMPDGIAALRAMGVGVPASAGRFQGIEFHDGPRTARGAFASGVGFGIRRTLLHKLLAEEAANCGVECLFQTRVTGMDRESIVLDQRAIRPRWIIGADGSGSRVREWAGLSRGGVKPKRYGFRRHFEMQDPPRFVELYFGDRFQAFVTPVGDREVGVAVTTSDPAFRVDQALAALPSLRARLGSATSAERGALTGAVPLASPVAGNFALVGDASGGVDSITGEGLCLGFQQAERLADALTEGNLSLYARAHRRLMVPPRTMAQTLLLLAGAPALRRAAMQGLSRFPWIFDRLLSAHAGGFAMSNSSMKGKVL